MGSSSNAVLTHHSTRPLTPTISQHTFHRLPGDQGQFSWRPSQYLELQLPAGLDLIGGESALDDERRRIHVTPCNPPSRKTKSGWDGEHEHDYEREAGEEAVVFITRNGSVTGLLGLPRFRSLTVQVVGVGGGFIPEHFSTCSLPPPPPSGLVCVAGGIGICAFLPFPSSPYDTRTRTRRTLLWSIHFDDIDLVTHLLPQGLLDPCQWTTMRIFLTSGTDAFEQTSFASLGPKCDDIAARVRRSGPSTATLSFTVGRMTMDDLSSAVMAEDGGHERGETTKDALLANMTSAATVFFCGSKSLEWQVKMWALKMTPPCRVHTTQLQK
ncbi:hypothetical protein AYO20_09849 [Fonsecaea nubica]|uniref:FAD-binding FR-type domain-containing protein n=1 Tax=Fonsecaea nubica TaxID=856822 RepID=A0A178CEW2_9EURO|nr:hypothetical protein AYO20_09849 [Fonsecaea nubica]OAL27251.1 hypothetical protein AYO20_09849 [Fonsecaea nubica]